MQHITITKKLLEKAGQAKKKYPCGASLRQRGKTVDVAFRA